MQRKFLETLHCPYCGANLKIEKTLNDEGPRVIDAIVKCECSKYPIRDEILVLKQETMILERTDLDNAVFFLEKGSLDKALNACLGVMRSSVTTRLATYLEKLRLPLGAEVASFYKERVNRSFLQKADKLSFLNIIDYLKLGDFGVYLKYRWSTSSFFGAIPMISLIGESGGNILDLCCGMGHASSIMPQLCPEGNIVCADANFMSLYLARKFFIKNAEYICLDANAPLPFEDGYFSAAFCLDAFHYITSKRLLARELERILTYNGLLLLAHLHNKLSSNPNPGKPLTQEGYTELFHGLNGRLIPEEQLLDDFVFSNKLVLTREFSEQELNGSSALALVASRNKDFFRSYMDVNQQYLQARDNLIINPIYRTTHKDGKILLNINWPSKFYESEFALTRKYMPKSYTIDEELSNILNSGESLWKHSGEIEALISAFILVNAPQNYV